MFVFMQLAEELYLILKEIISLIFIFLNVECIDVLSVDISLWIYTHPP